MAVIHVSAFLFCLFQKLGDHLTEGLCQGGMAFACQVHMVHGVKLAAHLPGVQECDTQQFALLGIPLGQLPGLFHTVLSHNRGHGAF